MMAVLLKMLRPRSFGVIALQRRHLLAKADKKKVAKVELKPDGTTKLIVKSGREYREQYIPITCHSLLLHLMGDQYADQELRGKFECFSEALQRVVTSRYSRRLRELKMLFDPINADKDTIATKSLSAEEQAASESCFLHTISEIIKEANFQELSRETVEWSLAENTKGYGVVISVRTDIYDVLRFWALGHENPPARFTDQRRLLNQFLGRVVPVSQEYLKIVILALRLKTDRKLTLKVFKQIPVRSFEMLLPDAKVLMSTMDKAIISSTVLVAILAVLAKVLDNLEYVNLDFSMPDSIVLTLINAVIGLRAWHIYKNRRNAYVLAHSRMLYYKHIASNRGALVLLTDRAEDELVKETLITYWFLSGLGRKVE